MKYLVTGATGFLGTHLCRYFAAKNIDYRATSRMGSEPYFVTGDLTAFNDWENLFKDINVVVHSAAKAHDMSGLEQVQKLYQDVNLKLTVCLATEAKVNHVKTFIFISTIKVNGEETFDHPFTAADNPAPIDPYGVSKYLAEVELLKLHEPPFFNVVIIRPCLIYGAGVRANFNTLISFVKKGWPLPFGLVNNKRSFVSVDNLVDLIYTCSVHPKASGELFLVSDGLDLSLAELIRKIAYALKKKNLLLPVPISLLRFIFGLFGKKELAQRLLSNLQVDITKTKQLLEWAPPFTMDQALKNMQEST